MWYLIEQFKWEDSYYHLTSSKIFKSDIFLQERSYNKNGYYYKLIKLDDEVQTERRTKKRGHV